VRRNKKGRIIESETYKQTMQCTDRIATAAYALLAEKPQDEQPIILRRVTELSSKLHDVVAEETPLIVSLALLTAIRMHEQAVQQRADELTAKRKP
jgi:hypothetical protein